MTTQISANHVLTLRLSLVGRAAKTYTFGKPLITVGRDPEADIVIDNPGVSREQLRLERTPTGAYEVVDFGSANGSFLNDRPLGGRDALRDGDRIRFGKFTLTAHYDSERRDSERRDGVHVNGVSPDSDQHTVVLTKDELEKVLALQRKAEVTPPTPPPAVMKAMAEAMPASRLEAAGRDRIRATIAFVLAGYVLGAATGAVAVWYALR